MKSHYKSKLLWFFPKWVQAFTLGNHVFFRMAEPPQTLVKHEMVHVAQYRKHGVAKFLWIYFIREWNVPYKEKTFEKEAYKVTQ